MKGTNVKNGRKLQNGNGASGPIGESESQRFFHGNTGPKTKIIAWKRGFQGAVYNASGDFNPSGTLLWNHKTREAENISSAKMTIKNDIIVKYVQVEFTHVFKPASLSPT